MNTVFQHTLIPHCLLGARRRPHVTRNVTVHFFNLRMGKAANQHILALWDTQLDIFDVTINNKLLHRGQSRPDTSGNRVKLLTFSVSVMCTELLSELTQICCAASTDYLGALFRFLGVHRPCNSPMHRLR